MQAVQEALKELRDLENKIEETKTKAVAAGAQVGQARLGVMQAQLGVLEGREAQASGVAARVGRMTEMEYQMAQQAALSVKQYGIDGVTRETANLASQYAPGFVGKEEEKRGADRMARDKELNRGFAEFDYTPSDVRGEIDELRKTIVKGQEAAKREAASAAASQLNGEEFARTIKGLAQSAAESVVKEAIRGVQQNNTRGVR